LFKTIHEIVFNSNGGYDWETVYNMPTWLRRFTFETLKEHYDKIAEEKNKVENLLQNQNSKELSRPAISPKQPTYTTNKAPKK
jgi:hypothetical protein